MNIAVNKTRAWKKLDGHYKTMKKTQMRDMFAEDDSRADKYTLQLENMRG